MFGSNGEIRTHTGHRMKVLHNHYATLPYRNTLGYLPIYLGILFRKMCFYMVGLSGFEPEPGGLKVRCAKPLTLQSHIWSLASDSN
jgi:hypothetical protein